MSKDFERAYIEMAQSEAPDLWNRIEAGLTEKSVSGFTKEKQKKKKIVYFSRKYAGIAAAVVCAAIIIPVGIYVNQSTMPKEGIMKRRRQKR